VSVLITVAVSLIVVKSVTVATMVTVEGTVWRASKSSVSLDLRRLLRSTYLGIGDHGEVLDCQRVCWLGTTKRKFQRRLLVTTTLY
jgi:hypothetical protein